ncbi:MAG: aspartate-semialdehyde dehydrogenase [Cyclobacteriaceae bacterium]
MKLAIVGATGLVGSEILKVIEERQFPYDMLIPIASARSVGKEISYRGNTYVIRSMEEAIALKPDIAIFSAGGSTSLEWAPRFEEAGAIVIDNSSAWRMSPRHKLIVPEVNASILRIDDRIIANPNCSTIQMVLALMPLKEAYGIKRIVVSTYQSVTGTGKAAVDQLKREREGQDGEMVYPHKIDMNVLPHIDVFMDNGYTKEEMKMVNETKKIFGDDTIRVTATAVRLPVVGGHSESINVELHEDFDMDEVRRLLSETPGIVVQDDPSENLYPMPIHAHGRDEVFVGRLRRDESQPNTLNMWVVSDNLRKGAATNAVQIAEYLQEHSLVY